jgi:transcriptional regulator with XRE-family HTH domain
MARIVGLNDTQLGTLFRAVRTHLRLLQEDVGRRAGVSQSSVSRIERGHFATLPLVVVRAVAAVLEIRLDIVPSWRGGSLERVMHARHSALHERLADRLAGESGWVSAAEVSFSIWGERGVIDRFAFHATRQMLAVFEIKADLGDPAGLVAQTDRYRRLALEVARGRGWVAEQVSCWVVVADTDTNRRRLAAHRELLRGAFPVDGRAFGEWLRDPAKRVDGLTFIAYPHGGTGTGSLSTVKRVRVARPRSDRA